MRLYSYNNNNNNLILECGPAAVCFWTARFQGQPFSREWEKEKNIMKRRTCWGNSQSRRLACLMVLTSRPFYHLPSESMIPLCFRTEGPFFSLKNSILSILGHAGGNIKSPLSSHFTMPSKCPSVSCLFVHLFFRLRVCETCIGAIEIEVHGENF